MSDFRFTIGPRTFSIDIKSTEEKADRLEKTCIDTGVKNYHFPDLYRSAIRYSSKNTTTDERPSVDECKLIYRFLQREGVL